MFAPQFPGNRKFNAVTPGELSLVDGKFAQITGGMTGP